MHLQRRQSAMPSRTAQACCRSRVRQVRAAHLACDGWMRHFLGVCRAVSPELPLSVCAAHGNAEVHRVHREHARLLLLQAAHCCCMPHQMQCGQLWPLLSCTVRCKVSLSQALLTRHTLHMAIYVGPPPPQRTSPPISDDQVMKTRSWP